MMRLVLVGIGVVMLGSLAGSRPAAADYWGRLLWNYYNEPWCLSAGQMDDCSYATFKQCNVARSGTGGSCYPNPRLASNADQQSPRGKRRRPQQ